MQMTGRAGSVLGLRARIRLGSEGGSRIPPSAHALLRRTGKGVKIAGNGIGKRDPQTFDSVRPSSDESVERG